MIPLTRLNGKSFILNAELIRFVESLPDTYITLTDGDRLVVRESVNDIMRLSLEYQRSKYLLPPPSPPTENSRFSSSGSRWPT
jgi:flagellar protein FlbD